MYVCVVCDVCLCDNLRSSFSSRPPMQAEPKEDYSHLPPAQQKKKLKGKISDLEAAVQKSTADK